MGNMPGSETVRRPEVKTENHGGPAFPTRHITSAGGEWTEEGMTLRDYFAASVVGGIRLDEVTARRGHPLAEEDFAKMIAEWAYRVADAMLAERQK